jgi:hypothetical protein
MMRHAMGERQFDRFMRAVLADHDPGDEDRSEPFHQMDDVPAMLSALTDDGAAPYPVRATLLDQSQMWHRSIDLGDGHEPMYGELLLRIHRRERHWRPMR